MSADQFEGADPLTEDLITILERTCSFWWTTGREWIGEIPTGDGVHAEFITANSLEALCKSVSN